MSTQVKTWLEWATSYTTTKRSSWASADSPPLIEYHDLEWDDKTGADGTVTNSILKILDRRQEMGEYRLDLLL
jgi:hypothetical protein